MSNVAKSFAKARLNVLPADIPIEEAEDDGGSSASSMSSTGTIIAPTALQRKPPAPVSWTDFFDQELYLESNPTTTPQCPRAKFHVYFDPPRRPADALIVLHHGAGSAAMSWALCARELRGHLPNCGILAVEAREHGSVVWDEAGEVDDRLHIDILSEDLVTMLNLLKEKVGWTELPRILLIGHSLGGAVVTHTAKMGLLGTKVFGFGVLDVVEGSAMEALKHMQAYLATRPARFKSLDSAVEWHIRSRTLRNIKSARASVPSLFIQNEAGEWVWRTDLSRTESYWENWFSGMSNKFLTARGAKLLILAGTDRLDKELMIGQMQGKFQLHVVPEAGHFVQEDSPQKTALMIAEFFRRNDSSTLVLPPKVSDLLAQGKKV
ncbi:protein phosphatase methylesteras-like protein 1 [Microthyrium microscopicum]|uniref:Protein phosphatase methylesterase 1 n=1 Tax=Microthyrium microscopicum TaxID=703497 RepID=A0A6A6US16_9PEZI|nr:protein phosphatase methylesteras-like protein 1 [Microthyrium microscopicum]